MYKEEFEMLTWSNLDTLASYSGCFQRQRPVELAKEMSGENGCRTCKKIFLFRWQQDLPIIMGQNR